MGKKRIIAETGAGQHGVASATVAARLGLECVVYMGATDIERQKINVYRMKLLGATVVPVTSGSATLKDALNEAMRDWVQPMQDTFYIIGTVAGPDPYPRMVADFNAIVGREAREQMLASTAACPMRSPPASAAAAMPSACSMPSSTTARSRSSAPKPQVMASGRHAASIAAGRPGVLHGNRTYVLCDDDGQIIETHSVSAGLDYPGVGPERIPGRYRPRATSASPMRKHCRPSTCWRIPRASCRRWNPAMRWRRRSSWRVSVRVTRSCCAICPAVATGCAYHRRARRAGAERAAAQQWRAAAGAGVGRVPAAGAAAAGTSAAKATTQPAQQRPRMMTSTRWHVRRSIRRPRKIWTAMAAPAVVSVALDHAGEVLIGAMGDQALGPWTAQGAVEAIGGSCEYYDGKGLPPGDDDDREIASSVSISAWIRTAGRRPSPGPFGLRVGMTRAQAGPVPKPRYPARMPTTVTRASTSPGRTRVRTWVSRGNGRVFDVLGNQRCD
jgi:tryptophan synthase beta chain